MSLAEAMKRGNAVGERARGRAQRAAIVAQLAVSQPLLVLAMLVVGMVVSQRPWKPTFQDGRNVLGVGIDFEARFYGQDSAAALMHTLRQRLSDHAIVDRTEVAERVASAFENTATGRSLANLEPESIDSTSPAPTKGFRLAQSEIDRVGPDYFETLGLPIVHGRGFEAADTLAGADNIIIPENVAAAFFPGQNPIGRRLMAHGRPRAGGGMMMPADPNARRGIGFTVVGVSRNQRELMPNERPTVYFPGGVRGNQVLLVRTRGPAAPAAELVQRELARLDPLLPIAEMGTLEQAARATARGAAKLSGTAMAIAMFALALVSLGLGGIILYSIGQRVPEIGVRVAMGATPWQIVSMFVGQGVRTAVIGAVLGVPLSLLVFVAATRLVFAASVTLNATATLVAALVLAGVVLLASWIPARRAAAVDPLVALRAD